METAQILTPETSVTPVSVQPPVEAPVNTIESPSSSSFEDGGAFEGKTNSKYKMVDILIGALWIIVPIYATIYYRKAIKKLEEEPSTDEFNTMKDDIEEVKYNLKKALGNKYQAT